MAKALRKQLAKLAGRQAAWTQRKNMGGSSKATSSFTKLPGSMSK